MKLILEHAGQQVEYEFTTRNGQTLTNQQATLLIEHAFEAFDGFDALQSPTLLQKAQYVTRAIAERLAHAARENRRRELNAANEEQLRSELE